MEGLAIRLVSQINSVLSMVPDSPVIHRAMEASRPVIPLVELRPANLLVILQAIRVNPTVIQLVVLNLDHLLAIHRVGLHRVILVVGHSLVHQPVIHRVGRRAVIHRVGRSLVRQRAIQRVVHKG